MYGTTLRISDGDRTAIADALRDKGEVNDLLVESRGESGEVEHILFSGRVLSRDGRRVLVSRAHDVTAHKKVERETHQRLARIRAQRALLVKLGNEPAALAGDVAGAARAVTAECAAAFDAERASVWLLDDAATELRCTDLFRRSPGTHESGAVIPERDFRAELRALKTAQYVDVSDPFADPRAAGLAESYVRPNAITALLDAVVRLEGRCMGVLCIEHVARRHVWEQDEIDFACRVANHLSVVLERRERRRAEERLRKAMHGHVRAMATTVEMRDPYTAGHERRVAQLAEAIASEMGVFSDHDVEGIRVAAYMHDLGKIAVPAEILSKPGKINNYELGIIQTHPQVGYDVLKEIDFVWPVAQTTLQHHERLDGSGYPQGLSGDRIIPEARVLGVADVVEAMVSHRPYRPALTIADALGEIRNGSGRAYDPAVVTACMRLFTEKAFAFEA